MKNLLLITLTIYALDAKAYRYRTCNGDKLKFSSNSLRYEAGENSYPAGSDRRASLEIARERWNQAPSNFSFGSIYWNKGVSTTNDTSEIWYSDSQSILDGAPAIALTKYNCSIFSKKIKAVDVVFDNKVKWMNFDNRFSSTAYSGEYRTVQTTAIHEMRHALGLLHSNTRYNIMGSDTTVVTANGGTLRAYVGEDSGEGAVFLYGKNSNDARDVSVTHRKYNGASGEYSSHRSVEVLTNAGAEVDNWVDAAVGFRVYQVRKGNTYKVEFTYENNGSKDTEDPVKVGYYLSTNDNITTGDRLLTTTSLKLTRNQPYTSAKTLTIPSDIASNKIYYVGAFVDYTNEIPELTGANNGTFVPVFVVD